jgi:sulfite reductase (NADPH) hemoprotein beta-component
MGQEAFVQELEKRCGFTLEPARAYTFSSRKDHYGWKQNHTGLWYFTLFIENGRVLDEPHLAMKTALLEIAKTGKANFRFTGNQNLILADIADDNKAEIEAILQQFGLDTHTQNASALRKNAIACVSFNTCPLALAEAQRYLPTLISRIEPLLEKHGLREEEITLRMTGCPNGCGRSPAAEIGFIGTAYGQYNLYIGGDRVGERLNRKYRDQLEEPAILEELDKLFAAYAAGREPGESFGDFVIREKLV